MIKQVHLSQIRPTLANNIQNIHQKSKVSKEIEHLKPLYAGGYPMSLLFAPRKKGDLCSIDSIYYSDYDIYFEDTDKAEEAIRILGAMAVEVAYNTDNATTLKVKHPEATGDATEVFQIVRKINGDAYSVLPTFDFVNCSIAYSPLENSFFMHKQAPILHNERILNILNPWMITDALRDSSEVTSNIIVQLLRFKKYCHRWDYSLSDDAFDLLIKAYEAYPELIVNTNQTIRTTGGPYSGQAYYAWRNQNVWNAVAGLMTCHRKWKDYDDKIGRIKATLPQSSEEALNQPEISQIPF